MITSTTIMMPYRWYAGSWPLLSAYHFQQRAIGLLSLYVVASHQPNQREAPFLGAVADTLAGVIERELAERARQRLVTILEATPDLVTITDPQGYCLYVNEGARELLGLDRKKAGPIDSGLLPTRNCPAVA
jgi:PAS domain-containing protein